jgi:alpha-tubulin suppressor-like RCC1 family protein
MAISGGYSHCLALKADGTIWAWGYNRSGQLGDGTTINKSFPVQVSGLSGAITIVAGGTHSLAIKSDGTVWAWGDNGFGELGDGSTTNSSFPVQVAIKLKKKLLGITHFSDD